MSVFAVLILTLINANALEFHNISFWKYIGNGYAFSSTNHVLGGFFAAIISYPLVAICTRAGANIILIAGLVITLLATFRFSIAEIISSIREKAVEKHEQMKEQKEYERIHSKERNRRENYDDYSEYDNDPYEYGSYDDDDSEEYVSFDDSGEYADDFTSEQNFNDSDSDDMNFTPEEDDYTPPEDDGLYDDAFAEQVVYQRPPYTLLRQNTTYATGTDEEAKKQGRALINALSDFGIDINISHISIGPAVTRFEIQLAKGVRIKSITSLSADIALALAAESVRIEAPIPGKQAVGVEIPNKQPTYVYLREILESKEFTESQSVLTVAVGKDIVGKSIVADISKMPHLMIAGSTGSGKSVCMNTLILSMVYKSSPADIRLILIDPKIVEFGIYSKLPHLLIPVVTETKKAASSLKWATSEMTRRYTLFANSNVRNIAEYNSALPSDEQRMPRIVIVIDELAELMMSAAKEVEDYITRIAQLGRACGIHLIVATQRPSVDIITGKIKANIISRIAFAVSDAINSKVILDATGAECLIGNGDMLFHPLGMQKPRRVQCAFVSSQEVDDVMKYMEEHNGPPIFDETVDAQITAGVASEAEHEEDVELDSVFADAARLVIDSQRPSISYIQQKLRLGYNRAARIMNAMELYGIVSGIDPIKKERKVTMTRAEFDARFTHAESGTAVQE